MTDKVYIVANKEQELEVLRNFEKKGLVWRSGRKATDSAVGKFYQYPYALVENETITWMFMGKLEDKTIVYDGRKEEKMNKTYEVTQRFMDKLIEWRAEFELDTQTGWAETCVDGHSIDNLPDVVAYWRDDPDNPTERNDRLIAIIQWLNGENVFEVEKLHKFVVRSNEIDKDGDYWYVKIHRGLSGVAFSFGNATQFDTREEAQEWANSHQVVVEI